MSDFPDLVGVAEVAEIFGVSKQAVTNWRRRHPDFPNPLAELRSGPVWQRAQVLAWGEATGVPIVEAGGTVAMRQQGPEEAQVTRTIATSNMKGGVGKSTFTANLAYYCAYRKSKRVLAVDLDPQFNLSQYMLGVTSYEQHVRNQKPTVFDVFEQSTPTVAGVARKKVKPADVVVPITKLSRGGRLDLIPSRLELAWTLKNPSGKEQLLDQFLDAVREQYDLILIDCPPTDSMLTVAAYMASDSVFVPVKPEFLSTIGLPLLARSLESFRDNYTRYEIDVLGIAFNAAENKPEHRKARSEVKEEARDRGWYVFEHEVSFSDSYPKGSRTGRPIFLTDYARGTKIDEFTGLGEEFVNRAGL